MSASDRAEATRLLARLPLQRWPDTLKYTSYNKCQARILKISREIGGDGFVKQKADGTMTTRYLLKRLERALLVTKRILAYSPREMTDPKVRMTALLTGGVQIRVADSFYDPHYAIPGQRAADKRDQLVHLLAMIHKQVEPIVSALCRNGKREKRKKDHAVKKD